MVMVADIADAQGTHRPDISRRCANPTGRIVTSTGGVGTEPSMPRTARCALARV